MSTMGETTTIRVNSKTSVMWFAWRIVLRHKFTILILLIVSVGAAFDEAVTPIMFDFIIRNFEKFNANLLGYTVLKRSIINMMAAWIMFDVLYRISGLIASYIYPIIESDVRMMMFKEVQMYRPSYFSRESVEGSVENSVADTADGVQEIVEFIITTLIPGTLAIFACVLQIFSRNTHIGMLITGWTFFHILITILLLKKSVKCSSEMQAAQNKLASTIVDSLMNRNITLQCDQQLNEYQYVNKFQVLEIKAHRNMLLFNEGIKFILTGILITVCSFLFLHILSLFVSKQLMISDVVFLFLTVFNIVRQVWQIGTQLTPFVEGLGQCAKGLSLLDENMYLNNLSNRNIFRPEDDSIEFRNVSLYEKERLILDNVSFHIKSKEKVAFLGKSGSGKTTIFKIILGLTSDYTGEVFIGKINIRHVNSVEVRNYCGMLDQKHYWFDRSVYENLKYGNPNATDKEIKEVCEKAMIYDFVEDLPQKWHTIVHFNTLSGGQLQRLNLARLLLRKSKILMFDELTNALDLITQRFLGKIIKSYTGTLLFTTHNLHYRNLFDRIIIIDEGQLVAAGTHEELKKNSKIYGEMLSIYDLDAYNTD
jgi:ATP-binding cassette subfamily B protein